LSLRRKRRNEKELERNKKGRVGRRVHRLLKKQGERTERSSSNSNSRNRGRKNIFNRKEGTGKGVSISRSSRNAEIKESGWSEHSLE